MLNLPNLLTILRILLVPVLVVVLLTKFEGKEFVGLAVFLLAALTDLLDGLIARQRQLETRLGKLLDPAADKILTSAAFISLVEMDRAAAWIVVIIVAREFAISTLRSVAASQNIVIGASWSGKFKTGSQVFAISLLIFQDNLGGLAWTGTVALWVALGAAVYSGVEYGLAYSHMITEDEVVTEGAGPAGPAGPGGPGA